MQGAAAAEGRSELAEAAVAEPEAPEQPPASPPAAAAAAAPQASEEAEAEGAPAEAEAAEQPPAEAAEPLAPQEAEAAAAEPEAPEQPPASLPAAAEVAAPPAAEEAEAEGAPAEAEAAEQPPVEAAEPLAPEEVEAAPAEVEMPEQPPASPPVAAAVEPPPPEEAGAAALEVAGAAAEPEQLPACPLAAEAKAEAEVAAPEAEADAAAALEEAASEEAVPMEAEAEAKAEDAAPMQVEADAEAAPAEPEEPEQPLAPPPAAAGVAEPPAPEEAEAGAEAEAEAAPAEPEELEQPLAPPPAAAGVAEPPAPEEAEAGAEAEAEAEAEAQELIEEEPRSAQVKDAIEEADGSAPAAQEPPPAPAGEAPAPALVLLLVGGSDGAHEAQVFRMRCDQPLQRLLATYAKFRQLSSDDGLWLARAEVDEKLDPTVTAGTLGLADGDRITVHIPPAAAGPQEAGTTAEKQQAAAAGARPQKRRQPQPPQQRRQRPRTEEPPVQEPKEQQPKRPSTAFFLWYTESRQAIATEIGTSQVNAVAKACGERWKAMPAEEKAAYESRVAEMRAEYDRAMADFVARGGVPKKRGAKKGRGLQASQRQRQLKRPTGGAYGVFLRSQREEIKRSLGAEVQAGDVAKEAERRWQELPEEVKREYQESFDQKMAQYKAALEDLQAQKEEIPSSPVGFVRSARVTQGPARGWTVSAWRNTRKAVCWKIVEPGRNSRTFRDFKELRKAVATDVYRTLDQTVKTGLLKRLSEPSAPAARAAARAGGDFETPKRSAADQEARQQATGQKAKRPRGERETPERLDRPILATQVFQLPEALRPKGEAWTCGCAAHLKRHPRCSASGDCQGQPALVHLRKSSTTFGRAETCDVVLGSALTPQMLSRCHAVLSCEDGFTLTDKGSVNGCLVNGRSVQGKCMLRSGDVITFGVQTHTPEFDYVFETRRGGY